MASRYRSDRVTRSIAPISTRCAAPHVVSSRRGFRTICAGLAWVAAICMTCSRCLTPKRRCGTSLNASGRFRKSSSAGSSSRTYRATWRFASSRLEEWEFLTAVAEEADCAILLDINNIFVNAFNHRFDALRYVDAVPVERVVQFHLAGHSDHGSYLLDTHDHPIRAEVWALYEHAVRRFGRVPTLIEWDDNIPDFEVLAAAADEARRRCDLVLAPERLHAAK